jgi:hypothetical protein
MRLYSLATAQRDCLIVAIISGSSGIAIGFILGACL